MDTATDILVEAGRLMIQAGVPWLPVIVMLLVLAAIRILGPKIDIKIEPPPYADGGGGDGGPSGPGVPLNTDPANPGGDSHGG